MPEDRDGGGIPKTVLAAVLFLLTFGGAVVSVTLSIYSQESRAKEREHAIERSLERRIDALEEEQRFLQRVNKFYHGDEKVPAVEGASR